MQPRHVIYDNTKPYEHKLRTNKLCRTTNQNMGNVFVEHGFPRSSNES